ncbi:MAG: hypothetical protein K0S56_2410 [Microvirga sp.]|jgi:hypothetical protein|nr:hypothetical protein [Microvirga sp.]
MVEIIVESSVVQPANWDGLAAGLSSKRRMLGRLQRGSSSKFLPGSCRSASGQERRQPRPYRQTLPPGHDLEEVVA